MITPSPIQLTSCEIATPLGQMVALASDEGIALLDFGDAQKYAREHDRLAARFALVGGAIQIAPGWHPHLEQLRGELEEYFAGTRRAFDVPLAPHGTAFEQRVWGFLRTIPYGQTRTYGQQAAAVGAPAAARAVGRANGCNFIGIIIPCHRVIGAGGALTGYAGGIDRKRWLLEHEQGALIRSGAFSPSTPVLGGRRRIGIMLSHGEPATPSRGKELHEAAEAALHPA